MTTTQPTDIRAMDFREAPAQFAQAILDNPPNCPPWCDFDGHLLSEMSTAIEDFGYTHAAEIPLTSEFTLFVEAHQSILNSEADPATFQLAHRYPGLAGYAFDISAEDLSTLISKASEALRKDEQARRSGTFPKLDSCPSWCVGGHDPEPAFHFTDSEIVSASGRSVSVEMSIEIGTESEPVITLNSGDELTFSIEEAKQLVAQLNSRIDAASAEAVTA